MNFQSVCVLGLGYIGLPTASTFATHGIRGVWMSTRGSWMVCGAGRSDIYEPGLRSLVQDALQSGQLTVSSQVPEADAFVIAVHSFFMKINRRISPMSFLPQR